MDNERYHLRRMDRQIAGRDELLDVIRGQRFLTLAMCRDNRPYLVTLNYGLDEAGECFYVHCATAGRKLEILRANPAVWGQVLEDRGYQKGQCTHHFRCVMFEGRAEFVEDLPGKRQAIETMIRFCEGDDESIRQVMARKVSDAGLGKTTILRVRVLAMTGKQGPAPKQ